MDEDLRYIRHFGLIAAPFRGIPDRRFIWLGEKQLENLAHLKVGIEERKGLLLLLGEKGSGKSVLLGCLLEILSGDIAVAVLREARIGVDRFFSFLADEFKIEKEISSKGDFLSQFRMFLVEAQSIGRKVLLVIEDAENQDDEILEQARLFSNMEENGEKLLSVLLIGNSELNRKLMEHRHRALLQRLAVRCRMDPFSTQETDAYIRHRMMVAGSFLGIFAPEAVEAIRRFSGGVPKSIDLICDHALMRACFDKQRTIDRKLLVRYAKEAPGSLGLEKGAGLRSERVALSEEEASNAGKARFRKAAPIGIALAVLLLFTIGIPFLNFRREKPSPAAGLPLPVSLYFESASAGLGGQAPAELERIADFLREHPETRVTIKGYADPTGSEKYNTRMAQSRADAAKKFLTEKGVAPSRVQALGMGAEKGPGGGQGIEDLKRRRRVDVEIRNSEQVPSDTR